VAKPADTRQKLSLSAKALPRKPEKFECNTTSPTPGAEHGTLKSLKGLRAETKVVSSGDLHVLPYPIERLVNILPGKDKDHIKTYINDGTKHDMSNLQTDLDIKDAMWMLCAVKKSPKEKHKRHADLTGHAGTWVALYQWNEEDEAYSGCMITFRKDKSCRIEEALLIDNIHHRHIQPLSWSDFKHPEMMAGLAEVRRYLLKHTDKTNAERQPTLCIMVAEVLSTI
jgi:hypothetical protein